MELLGIKGFRDVEALAGKVLSGDISGKEAHAAQIYFPRLFPGSSRRQDTVQNAALNYGYAILRGAVARALTSYGLQPALGIHHVSELNPFNLADDLLEPFRPVIDLWVLSCCKEDEEFTQVHRIELMKLLHCDIKIQEKRQTVLRGIDLAAGKLASAYLQKDPKEILLPTLLPLEVHRYE